MPRLAHIQRDEQNIVAGVSRLRRMRNKQAPGYKHEERHSDLRHHQNLLRTAA